MNRYLLLLIAIFLLFSCSKDTSVNRPLTANQMFSSDCFEEAEPTSIASQCIVDTTTYCQIVEIQESFPFSDDEKEWLKSFCLNTFDKIFFHNENGEEIFMEIDSKGYFTNTSLRAFENCSDDRLRAYCVQIEQANVGFWIPDLTTTFDLNLTKIFEGEYPDDLRSSLALWAFTISEPNVINNQFSLTTHLNIDVSLESNISQEFFDEITILDRTFQNVFTSKDVILISPNTLKFFYNKEFGIVSFIDNNGTQWVLND